MVCVQVLSTALMSSVLPDFMRAQMALGVCVGWRWEGAERRAVYHKGITGQKKNPNPNPKNRRRAVYHKGYCKCGLVLSGATPGRGWGMQQRGSSARALLAGGGGAGSLRR